MNDQAKEAPWATAVAAVAAGFAAVLIAAVGSGAWEMSDGLLAFCVTMFMAPMLRVFGIRVPWSELAEQIYRNRTKREKK